MTAFKFFGFFKLVQTIYTRPLFLLLLQTGNGKHRKSPKIPENIITLTIEHLVFMAYV